MKKGLLITLMLATAMLSLTPLLADDAATFQGEVLDMACYIAKGAKGEGHADCAKACVKNGQPMGLLTADGKVLLLAASHDDGAPYEALKDLAGSQAKVTGTLSERDGVPMVTVTGASAAN